MHDFAAKVEELFNPWTLQSATSHMALLLYGLVRATRPRTVVEYGAGYTTPFLARALSENRDSFHQEKELLIKKSAGLLDALRTNPAPYGPFREWPDALYDVFMEWLDEGNQATCLDPRFYLLPHDPRLFCFEALPAKHDYCVKLCSLLAKLGVADVIRMKCGTKPPISGKLIPRSALPVDFAWNDFDHYREFFQTFWPLLNPQGGIMVFHYGSHAFEDDVSWMKKQRAEAGDLELLTVVEPHKFAQNGSFVLRRTSGCATPFAARRNDWTAIPELFEALRLLEISRDRPGKRGKPAKPRYAKSN